MNSCLHCKKPFGLIRHWGRLRFDWERYRCYYEQYCSEKCETEASKELQQRVRVLNFQQWLHQKPP